MSVRERSPQPHGASHGRPLVGSDGRFRGPWFTPRRNRRGRDIRGGIVRVRRARRRGPPQTRRNPVISTHRGDRFRPVLRGGRFGVAGVRRVLAAALRQHQRDVVRAVRQVPSEVRGHEHGVSRRPFITVDIDHLDDDVLDELDVETIPTFLLMRGGREVTRVVGVAHKRPARPLAAAIRRHLCS